MLAGPVRCVSVPALTPDASMHRPRTLEQDDPHAAARKIERGGAAHDAAARPLQHRMRLCPVTLFPDWRGNARQPRFSGCPLIVHRRLVALPFDILVSVFADDRCHSAWAATAGVRSAGPPSRGSPCAPPPERHHLTAHAALARPHAGARPGIRSGSRHRRPTRSHRRFRRASRPRSGRRSCPAPLRRPCRAHYHDPRHRMTEKLGLAQRSADFVFRARIGVSIHAAEVMRRRQAQLDGLQGGGCGALIRSPSPQTRALDGRADPSSQSTVQPPRSARNVCLARSARDTSVEGMRPWPTARQSAAIVRSAAPIRARRSSPTGARRDGDDRIALHVDARHRITIDAHRLSRSSSSNCSRIGRAAKATTA